MAYCSSVMGDDSFDELLLEIEESDYLSKPKSTIEEQHLLESELNDFCMQQRNDNTKNKTRREANRFLDFVKKMGHTKKVYELGPEILDALIGKFLKDLVHKKTGKTYEPGTVTSYHRSIARYLRDNGYNYDIVTDEKFALSKRTLAAKRTVLKKEGKGNRENAADALSPQDEEKLWEMGLMGWDTPMALIRALWFLTTKLMGFRGCDETRQMQWGDIQIGQDEHGEYLVFKERQTKTRTGASTDTRSILPKAYENPDNISRCPVVLYREYKRHRPDKFMGEDTPFYLSVNYPGEHWADEKKWYKCVPMGRNTINNIMKDMATKAKLQGKKTNHSVRKTTCERLLQGNVPPTLIQNITGHKNVQSISNYAKASTKQHYEMQRILSGRAILNSLPAQVNDMKATKESNPELVPPVPREGHTQSLVKLSSPEPIENSIFENNIQKKTFSSNASVSITSQSSLVESRTTSVLQGLFYGANMQGSTINVNINA